MEINKRKNINSLTKRFKIGVVIFAILLLGVALLPLSPKIIIKSTFWLCAATWLWLFMDYEILQLNKLYAYSFAFAVLILGYGYFQNSRYGVYDNKHEINIGSAMPLILLIIQMPLRLLFIRIINREPIVNKQAITFLDFVYTAFLWLTIALTFVLRGPN